MRLTPRDLEILRHVARHRFLNSAQIAALTGGSAQQLLRRLQGLFHSGHLDRPRAQLSYFTSGGTRPMVYGLARAGARALAAPGQNRTSPDNRTVKQLYLQHTLLVADSMIAFQRACRGGHAPRLLQEENLAPGQPPSTAFKWTVPVTRGDERRRTGLFPDRTFALEDAATGERVLYFLEADRATMPVTRRSLTQSSFLRKLLAYEATWTQELHRERFGVKRFRVLTVTTTPARAANLAAACDGLTRARGLFLFTNIEAITTTPSVLALEWITANQEKPGRVWGA